MRVCRSRKELEDNFAAVARLAAANFGTAGVYVERLVERARQIEVQVFGDGAGNVVAVGERDCSAQRRNQKVIEETPAPGLPGEVRERLFATTVKLGRAVAYRSAGTVEFWTFRLCAGRCFIEEPPRRLRPAAFRILRKCRGGQSCTPYQRDYAP
jgi:urea carboxylase